MPSNTATNYVPYKVNKVSFAESRNKELALAWDQMPEFTVLRKEFSANELVEETVALMHLTNIGLDFNFFEPNQII